MWLNSKRFKTIRFYMAFFALLAFSVQSFAVVNLHCGPSVHPTNTAVMKANTVKIEGVMGLDHKSHMPTHDAPVDYADNSLIAADCCDQDSCSQSGCISTSAAVVSNTLPLVASFTRTLHTEYPGSLLTQSTSSLFRPPITH